MFYTEQKVREELFFLAEKQYKEFVSHLIPGCTNILGVRIPSLRKIAKEIAKEEPLEYLTSTSDIYFEETMIKALIIGNMQDNIEIILEQAVIFIPKIDNWSLCDSFCNELKIVRAHKNRVWQFLHPYCKSKKPYEVRFAVVMLLSHFIQKKYLDEIFTLFNNIKHEDYYVKMAVAWAVSICLVKFPKETFIFLKQNNLDDETYRKSLQKIRESRRIDKKTKEYINTLRR